MSKIVAWANYLLLSIWPKVIFVKWNFYNKNIKVSFEQKRNKKTHPHNQQMKSIKKISNDM